MRFLARLAKVLMLLVTLAWIGALYIYLQAPAEDFVPIVEKTGGGYIVRTATGTTYVGDQELHDHVEEKRFLNIRSVSLLYGVVMIALFVSWFAVKP